MLKTPKVRGLGRPLAFVFASLLGLSGIVVTSSEAGAAEIPAIDTSSIEITKLTDEEPVLYKWSVARVAAQWRIPDGAAKAGDTFKLVLPKELGAFEGVFDLKDEDDESLTYGGCEAALSEVVCTLNKNVENKHDVNGSFWVKTQVKETTKASSLEFETSNGVKVQVPLPEGQQEIGYSPILPTETSKSGWFPGTDRTAVYWRVVIPGSKISGKSEATIVDEYRQEGATLTMSEGYPKVFWVPATPECWGERVGEGGEGEIVGIFSGTNPKQATYQVELFENVFLTDLTTTRQLNAYTAHNEIYQDATFFTKGTKQLDEVMARAHKLPVDWQKYQLNKNSQELAGVTGAVNGVYGLIDGMLWATALVSVAVIGMVLYLWMNERKREAGVLLATGVPQSKIVLQYIAELVMIAVLSFGASYVTAGLIAQQLGDHVVSQAAQNATRQAGSSLGGASLGGETSTTSCPPTRCYAPWAPCGCGPDQGSRRTLMARRSSMAL